VRLPDPALLLITDRKQATRPLVESVAAALAAGCRWVSLREKDLPDDQQVALADALKPSARQWGACMTIHGTSPLAQIAGVDGVHLAAGGDVKAARAMLGRSALIGVSVHGIAEVEKLDANDVDYAIAGPTFETQSKPGYGPILGLGGIAAMAGMSPVPILAIGGIVAERITDVILSGAAGVAVMGGVMRADRPGEAMTSLLNALASSGAPKRGQRPR
jgi:thiamine-phosphate pyrophosphorylase